MEFNIEDYYKGTTNKRLLEILSTYRYNIKLIENRSKTMPIDPEKLDKALENLRYYSELVIAEMTKRGMEVPQDE